SRFAAHRDSQLGGQVVQRAHYADRSGGQRCSEHHFYGHRLGQSLRPESRSRGPTRARTAAGANHSADKGLPVLADRRDFRFNALQGNSDELTAPGHRSTKRRKQEMATATTSPIQGYLGAKADSLLGFSNPKISKDRLHLPGPDFIDRIWTLSDRNPRVLTSLHRLFNTGRL